MRYHNTDIKSISCKLPDKVISSEEIEEILDPLYKKLRLRKGQLEALTGVKERRQWDKDTPLSYPAIEAGKLALGEAGIRAEDLDMLVYAAVCRENLEPATACSIADGLGLPSHAHIFDLSNACLGVMNAILLTGDAIESGRIKRGMVVACESSKQIMDITIKEMLDKGDIKTFTRGLATLTGGSGASALVLARKDIDKKGHSLSKAMVKNDTSQHKLCIWGPDTGIPASMEMRMQTDAANVLDKGVKLGHKTFQSFLKRFSLEADYFDKIICHQVGASHRESILNKLGIPEEKDFSTFPFFGNMGTVSLPVSAAIASEQGFIKKGDKVGFFGIGSGLNCLIISIDW